MPVQNLHCHELCGFHDSTAIGRLSPVTYTIEIPDKRRKDHAIHVTALKVWHPPMVNLASLSTDPDYTADIPDYSPSTGPIFPELGEHLDEAQRADLRRIWDDYPQVITHSLGKARSTVHKIDTGSAAPIRLHPYRILKVWQEPVKAELTKLLETGIIEPSSAPWAAPMFAVPKKTPGQIRLVNDCLRLNAVTVPDPYYQQRIEDVLYGMAEAKFFTIIDLAQGFYQIPIPPADRDKTTVVTPFGKYRFTVMPFGLRNAPATFQHAMDNLFHEYQDFIFVYIDDVAIFSRTWAEHVRHIRLAFDKLRAENLTIQPAKSQLGRLYCEFLGHNVGNGFISPLEAKTSAVKNFMQPRTKSDVRAFLGLAGYYRQFIPNFSCIAAPLSDLTKAALPDQIEWSEECQTAFDQIRDSLCDHPVLRPPRYDREFLLQTDASGRGIGAVLAQADDDGTEHPIAYYSRKFLPRESRYSATE